MTAPTIAIPSSSEELEEWIGDTSSPRMQQVLKEKGKFQELIQKYVKSIQDKDPGIAAQLEQQKTDLINAHIETEVQLALATALKDDRKLNRPDMTPGTGRTKGVYPRALGAAVNGVYDTAVELFEAVYREGKNPGDKLQKLQNAFGSQVPSDGGFLIPEVLRAELMRVALESAVVRPRARVVPMDSLRVPFPAIDSTTDVGSVFGGVTAYWTQEGASLNITSPSFGRVVLDAKKLTIYTEVPNELIQDSAISIEPLINELMPEALSFYEDDGFVNGGGVGVPLGFTNADAAVSVAKVSGQATNTIVWENIVGCYARMLPSSLGRAVWVCSIDTFPELATMALSVGTGGSAIWLNNGVVGPPMTILGRPVIFTEKTPALGSAGDVNFVDLGYYLVGDRMAMSVARSDDYRFGNDVVALRVIERVDGRPWIQSPITPRNSGPALSPFVKIAARP
jgi:HK97 family phage major capsid protein